MPAAAIVRAACLHAGSGHCKGCVPACRQRPLAAGGMPRQANQARGGGGSGTRRRSGTYTVLQTCPKPPRPGAARLWVALGAGCPIWPVVLVPRNSLGLCLGAPLDPVDRIAGHWHCSPGLSLMKITVDTLCKWCTGATCFICLAGKQNFCCTWAVAAVQVIPSSPSMFVS